jgi:hypothetical protein
MPTEADFEQARDGMIGMLKSSDERVRGVACRSILSAWLAAQQACAELANEHVVNFRWGDERVRIRQGGREWLVSYDGLVDEYVCRPVRDA